MCCADHDGYTHGGGYVHARGFDVGPLGGFGIGHCGCLGSCLGHLGVAGEGEEPGLQNFHGRQTVGFCPLRSCHVFAMVCD